MRSALRPVRLLQAVFFGLLLVIPSAVQGQDVVGKVTQLNKKALEAYDNLEFDQAKTLLTQAIEQCQSSGLEKHPIRARSHVHLGVVLIAGFKQKDEGTKMFCEALKITPEIKLTKSLANPELQEAFDEAARTCGGRPAGPPPGITHEPVTKSACGAAVAITATVTGTDAKFDKVTLFYHRKGVADYAELEMVRGDGDTFKAEIPAAETTTSTPIVYYIAAQTSDGLPVASKGNALDPMTISTACGAKLPPPKPKTGGDEPPPVVGPKLVFGLGAGTGFGWVSGASPEVNSPSYAGTSTVSGINMAALLHVAPEIGYLLTPSMMLSLQGRVQIITGGVKVADEPGGTSGCPVGTVNGTQLPLCETAKWAPSVLAKLTFYFSRPEAKLRPFVGVAVGGGYVRNSVKLTEKDAAGNYVYGHCVVGDKESSPCKDTVRIGPVLGGPLGGLMFNATRSFGFALTLQALAGFPDFGINLDVTGSAILKL